MAERKKQEKATKKTLPDSLSVRIQVDPNPDTPSYYVNYAAVSHSEYDFMISVLRIPNQLGPEQTELAKRGEAVPVEPMLQIILPPRLINGLINALTIQKEKYEQEHGPIGGQKKTGN